MFKKLALLSMMAITPAVSMADMAPYVGLGVGLINNSANVKSNGLNQTIGAYRGMPFNLYAGYGGLLTQSLYLAGELDGTIGVATISNDNSAGLRSTYGLGASVLPGYMLSDRTMVFLRAGVVRSYFPDNTSNSRNGGQFGGGLQTTLAQNVDLRGEYTYVAYQAKNNSFGSVAPNSDQFTVDLIYKFE